LLLNSRKIITLSWTHQSHEMKSSPFTVGLRVLVKGFLILSVFWRKSFLSSHCNCQMLFMLRTLPILLLLRWSVVLLTVTRLDYCNALLAGSSQQILLVKIQRVMNCLHEWCSVPRDVTA